MTAVPRISVLLPVRDGMPWLPSAVASVLEQTCRDLELIVLEDGSTDDTPRFLETVQDSRVRVVTCGGVGIAHALNLGLATARAEIIARQDADDESRPNRLVRQLSVLDSCPEIDLVATTADYIDASGATVDSEWVQTVRRQQDVAETPDAIAKLMVITCCVTHGSIAARARVLRAAGGYRPEMVPAEDYDLWLRLLPNHRLLKLPERLYQHRLHDAQSGARRRALQTHKSILAKLLYLRREHPELPVRPRLAIEGGTRGEAFYQSVAPEAGFEVVSGSEWDVLALTDFTRLSADGSIEGISAPPPAFLRERLSDLRDLRVVGNFVLRGEGRRQPWSTARVRTPRSIVHLSTFLQGGAGRAITDLACAQRRAGDSVLVVLSRTGEPGYDSYPHYLAELEAARVPVLLEDSLFKRDPAANQHVLQRLCEVRPPGTVDLVHAHAGVPARIGRCYAERSSRRVVVIQTQHGCGTNKTREQEQEDLVTLHAVDRVVVTSESTGALLVERGVPGGRIVYIPCGLPAEVPRAVAAEAQALRAALDAERRPVIGCVGSVTANKNQILLLQAMARAADDRTTAIFIGEGGEQLAGPIERLGLASRVRALGYRPRADQWLRAFDVLVVPSLTEGQGLVVLEAFRAGVPVIASDIPALRSLVTHGETGWLFASADAGALARTIDRALAAAPSERARITASARARFLMHYTVDVMVTRHEALYQAQLESNAGEVPVT